MKDLIQRLPKTELHLHIEGSLEPELMFQLADRNRITIPFKSVEEVHKAYHFTNLQSFLNIYYQSASVLIQEQDFYDLTFAYLKKAHQQNIRHTEIFFDPQTHVNRGIAFETVLNGIHGALEAGSRDFGITSGLILCFLRDQSAEEAMKILKLAKAHKNKIIGIGLDSAEVGNPPVKFEEVFHQAKQEGFHLVAHAGEEGPPEYMWEAIEHLHVERIDHGVQCLKNPELVKFLVKTQLPLTVCPLSNIRLCVFPDMAAHPLKKILEFGICATVNADDPAFFGGYLTENYMAAQAGLNFSEKEIFQLASNGIRASFASAERKMALDAELQAFSKDYLK